VIIEGEPIHFSDVELEARAQGVIKDGEKLEPGGADYERILQELIDQKLLAQEAGRRGLDQPEDAQFRLAMAKERTLGLLLMEDLVASKVTPEAVERLYREQLKLLQLGQETRVRQIVVATQAEAVALKRQLDRGADFTKLAFQRSLDADTRLDGGDLGFITPESRPQAFAQAVQATEVGKVSEPFELDRSWRLVMVVERREEQPPSPARWRRSSSSPHPKTARCQISRHRPTAMRRRRPTRRPPPPASPQRPRQHGQRLQIRHPQIRHPPQRRLPRQARRPDGQRVRLASGASAVSRSAGSGGRSSCHGAGRHPLHRTHRRAARGL
jgi:peptidyl-prolyl cis-trans isomerase C